MLDLRVGNCLFDKSKITRVHTYEITKRKVTRYFIYFKLEDGDEFTITYTDKEVMKRDFRFLTKGFNLLTEEEKQEGKKDDKAR